ncbi:hypothetical protein GCM10010349_57260 [Streptomyces flavofungini]|uniref:Uncharacterized protein n=1 Tax=Streptomyces flavofungini TaxID=68200 RepID=A0ABS0X7M8_9ACTN|nr:hypothetical protein [Streptomyces flavofungini]MBJ3809218.1 hypothetical protein [Streptomyces flavofungini]GHC76973.1 hypothetical protein GCM10010349_57260 [Streptomyces flavofungini]
MQSLLTPPGGGVTTAALPQRVVDATREVPPAGEAAFTARTENISREDVASDMGGLATRVRNLMDLQGNRPSCLPLGGNLFDVLITASGAAARAVVGLMDEVQIDGCGPVIEDPVRSWLYWLVPPGSSTRWAPHRYGICLGQPHRIGLPSLGQAEPPGAYWLRPFKSDRLVPPAPLRDLLDSFGPSPVPHEVLLAAELRAS